MQRNMELIRDILVETEKIPFDGKSNTITIERWTESEINYHVYLLADAGLVDARDMSSGSGKDWRVKAMTFAGHEFLDASRSATVWAKAKTMVLNATGTLTLEALKGALPEVMKAMVKEGESLPG